jgi:hypothetical protein
MRQYRYRNSQLLGAAFVLGCSFVFLADESRAQTCTDGSCTISFNYSGTGVVGSFGSSSGNGSFTIPVPTNNPTLGLGSVSAFQFIQTTSILSSPPSFGTYTYDLGNLTGFSLNFATPAPTLSNILSLQTNTAAVSSASGNAVFFPESFSASAGSGKTDTIFGQTVTAGTVTLNQASVAAAIVQGAVTVTTGGPISGTNVNTSIQATFKPNFGLSLQNAANLSGFIGYNWVQTVNSAPPNTQILSNNGTPVSFPTNDPPPSGFKNITALLGFPVNSYPYYYDPNSPTLSPLSLSQNVTLNTLS